MKNIQEEFLHKIGLENLSEKNGVYSFRCPICGDSVSNKQKKRGILLPSDSGYWFYCHNCNASIPFSKFLSEIAPELITEYNIQKFKSGVFKKSFSEKPHLEASIIWSSKDSHLIRCSELEKSHEAIKYLLSRKVPESSFKNVFWCSDIQKMINEKIPKNYKSFLKSGLVWEMRNETGSLVGFQCRTIRADAPKTMRFAKFVISSGGFIRNGIKSPFIVLEGPIDGMFFENSIALCSTGLKSFNFSDTIYFFDQEPRNSAVCRGMERAIKNKQLVCILPKKYHGMDINDIIVKFKMSPENIKNLISENSFKGIHGLVRLAEFRKD